MLFLVLSGVNGVESQSLAAWEKLKKQGNQPIVYINKLDVDGANYKQVLEQIEPAFGVSPFPMTIPIYVENHLDGVVDVFHQLALYRSAENPRKMVKGDIPDFIKAEYAEARKKLIDVASEFNDDLMEAYLAGQELPPASILKGIQEAARSESFYLFSVVRPSRMLGFGN